MLLFSKNKAVISYVLTCFLASCTSTTVDEFRQGETGIESDESVVILGRRQASDFETKSDFVECVGKGMSQGENAISVVPEREFVDAMFPWFEPRTAPKGLPRLKRLMQENVVRERVKQQNIRYLVWLDGSTETMGQGGSISCAVGPAGGGCFGFAQWDKISTYDATIWDLVELTEKGRLRVDSEGTSYLIGAVAPIPLLTPVKSDACGSLGNQLKKFFTVD